MEQGRPYREAARQYCALIEGYRQQSRASFVKELERSLAFLYYAGSQLPDVAPATSHGGQPKPAESDGFGEIQPLRTFLGDYDTYREVFDPMDPNDEPIHANLACDLLEIYQDSVSNLRLLDRRDVVTDDILWEWRFSFSHHWGRHVASALRVVNALVHSYYAGDIDDKPTSAL